MEFDWDDAKDEKIRAVRAFGFADVLGIFQGRTVVRREQRTDYGEVRVIAIGAIGGDFFTVVYTDRDGVRRLITAWPSSAKERAAWRE